MKLSPLSPTLSELGYAHHVVFQVIHNGHLPPPLSWDNNEFVCPLLYVVEHVWSFSVCDYGPLDML